MYKWVVGKDSTIEFVGDRKKGEAKDLKSGKQESDGKPSRASRRKGRLPPQRTVKIEPPYPDESDPEMDTTEEDDDGIVEELDSDTGVSVLPKNTDKTVEETESQNSSVVKEEPVTDDDDAYGVMPTSAGASTASHSPSGTDSEWNSVNGSQASTADMSDSACDLSTGPRKQPTETANIPTVPHTLPLANGIVPTIIQSGTPIFVAAVPSIATNVQAVPGVDGNNPLNLIASTAALAPKVAVTDTARKSNELNGTDRLIAASKAVVSANRKRADKQAVPDNQKDSRYYERRRRNNLAAKRSRDARRAREEEMSDKIAQLEAENAILRAQLNVMKERADSLRKNLEEGSSTSS